MTASNNLSPAILPQENDTICAIATATGGAIGIVRISGGKAVAVADTIFHGRQPLGRAHSHTAHFGTIKAPDEAQIIDEVIATVFRNPHSYTGEDCVEFSCHGSVYILQQVLTLLCQYGCRLAKPGEFTRRAFLNGKLDLSQAEAVADLIASESRNQHQVALAQLRGCISSHLATLRDKLLHLTALLELELDFSDHEDLEFADRSELISLAQETEAHIARMASTFAQGQAIRLGIPVAIVGRTNVGKSTLLNALLGDNRAIVSDIHGTTRDTVEDTLIINGQTFRLIDTAGLRTTTDAIEQAGIARSLEKLHQATIVLWVVDSIPTQDERDEMLAHTAGRQLITVWNKCDLSPAPSTFFPISAKHGENIESLKTEISRRAAQPNVGNDPIITNSRHHLALLAALEDLRRAINAMQDGLSADLVAEDLRLCITRLNTILGHSIESQDTLNTIFSRFCIGK